MARRKELRYLTVYLQEGFGGTGAVNDTLVGGETVMGVDTLVLADSRTIVPEAARFTTVGIPTVRTITASNNSQQWNLTNGGASAGTFDLTYNGEVAAGIAFDATIAVVQAAIDLLPGVIAGSTLTVSGTDAGPWDFESGGTGANVTTNTLSYDGSGLTGGPGVLTVTQDGTTTYELTFTPAIDPLAIPADDDAITFLPRRIEMKVGEGNVEHTVNKDPQVDFDRDRIDGAREGREQAMDCNFSYVYDWLRSDTGEPPTPSEVLDHADAAADWLTTADDKCEAYQLNFIVVDSPDCSGDKAEVIFYRNFIAQTQNASVEAASVTASGICISTRPDSRRVVNDPDVINALV